MLQTFEFATLGSLWRTYDTLPRRLAFRAQSQAEYTAWDSAARRRLRTLLGGFPATQPPLDAHTLASQEYADYRQEKVVFHSAEGVYVPCYVLTPTQIAPPYHPVIALHGHGSGGAAHVVGLTRQAERRHEEEEHIRLHNYDYGRQLAKHGFMVFAPEQRGFGERLEPHRGMVFGDPMWHSSCRGVAFNALLLGKTVLGLRVWDVMRTIDYIASRPEAMSTGIGCVGLSGGGTTTLYAAALEPRISAAVVSGAFGSFRTSIMSTIHCECNYIPGILEEMEMADVAGLIAPRPLLIENGTYDPIFPVQATRTATQEVARVYDLLDATDRFEQDIFAGGHRFSGAKAFTWLARWLS